MKYFFESQTHMDRKIRENKFLELKMMARPIAAHKGNSPIGDCTAADNMDSDSKCPDACCLCPSYRATHVVSEEIRRVYANKEARKKCKQVSA